MSDDDSLASDLLRGVPAISKFLGEDERRTYYILETGQLPAGKIGQQWVASKRVLRERIAKIVSGE
jgi:hypothetical protein